MAIEILTVESAALRNNPLGDPHIRKLHVIVPDDLGSGESVPCLWWLTGYAGVGAGMLPHDPWQEGLEERLIRLRKEGKIGKMLVALPDAFTKFGGSQYIASSAHGDYETYLVKELPDAIEHAFPAIKAHGIAGKSSGGYGAIVQAMKHPERFAAVATHSGDMGFRLAYLGDIPQLMNAVHNYGGVEKFAAAFEAAMKKKDGRWFGPISVLAMCAAYSPDPTKPLGLALPFDLQTKDLDDAVLERWWANDPVRLIDDARHQAALKQMRLVFVDCGNKDEHQLHWGARAFRQKLELYGIAHRYEEFDDGHRNTSYRLDVSLPLMYQALAGPDGGRSTDR